MDYEKFYKKALERAKSMIDGYQFLHRQRQGTNEKLVKVTQTKEGGDQ